ncbi:MAG: hypothetical protein HYV09_15200 [Deltaproteobacteria bacterium]|nr:hypothetical protein [Deltaproteobacteria bacterium]
MTRDEVLRLAIERTAEKLLTCDLSIFVDPRRRQRCVDFRARVEAHRVQLQAIGRPHDDLSTIRSLVDVDDIFDSVRRDRDFDVGAAIIATGTTTTSGQVGRA